MSSVHVQSPETFEQLRPQLAGREEYLQSLFGTDIDHARPYIDAFAVNVETGSDSLRYIMSGEVTAAAEGIALAHGFHHEPSAGADTYVTRESPDNLNSRERKELADRPFNPTEPEPQ